MQPATEAAGDSMDKLEFLEGAEAPVEDVRAEEVATPPEVVETPQEQPQIEVQAPPNATLTPPVIEQPKPDPGYVPITVVLDEREKRQRLEAELAQYKQAQQPAAEVPEFIDPEGTAFIQQQLDARLWQQTLTFSERFAKKEYGAEVVDEAFKWAFERCGSDPIFNAKIRQSDDPYGVAVQEYRREKIASEVTDTDYEAFKAWKAAQAEITQQQPAAQAVSAASAAPVTPPRSIASAPSAGGVQHVPSGPGQAYDTLFTR